MAWTGNGGFVVTARLVVRGGAAAKIFLCLTPGKELRTVLGSHVVFGLPACPDSRGMSKLLLRKGHCRTDMGTGRTHDRRVKWPSTNEEGGLTF